MDLNKFTQKAREGLAAAQQLAAEMHHQEVTSKHLLAALIRQEDGLAGRFLAEAGADLPSLQRGLEELLRKIPAVYGSEGQLHLGAGLARVLAMAEKEAATLKDEYLSVEHFLLALIEEGENDLKELLRQQKVNRNTLLNALKAIRGSQRVTSENPEATYEALERYGRDLTKLAAGRQARPGDRPGRGDPAGDADPVPPHQEQPGADRRAGRRQDRHRGGPGPAHRGQGRAGGIEGQADHRPGHGLAGGRGQVPGRVRGAPEGGAEGGRAMPRAGSFCSSTSCTPWWAPGRPRAPWMPATCSSRCWPAANCTASAPPPWTSTASTSRRTPPWSAASSR